MKLLSLFVIILLSSSFLFGNTIGKELSIDITSSTSSQLTQTQWSCLKDSGNSRVIIQAWSGKAGYNFELLNAYNQAIKNDLKVDIYASLCSNCAAKIPSSVAIKLIIYNLNIENIQFNKLWIDIEKGEDNWLSNQMSNAEYILETIEVAEQLGVEIGIYTTRNDWESVVGSLSSLHNYPLWLKLSNDINNTGTFGGWETPSITQDLKDIKMCDAKVNLNTNHTINPNSTVPNNTVSYDAYGTPNHTINPNSTIPNNTVSYDVYHAPNHTINPNSTIPNNTVSYDVYHAPNHTINPNSTYPPNNTVSYDVYHAPNHIINPNSTIPNNTVSYDAYGTPNHTINPNSTIPNNTVSYDVYHAPNHTINPNSTYPPNNTVSYDVYHTPNHTINPNSTTSGNLTTSGNSTLSSSSSNNQIYTKIDNVASTGKGDSGVYNNKNNNNNNNDNNKPIKMINKNRSKKYQ